MVLCQQQKGTEAPATYLLQQPAKQDAIHAGLSWKVLMGRCHFAEPSFYCIGGSGLAGLVVTEVREQAQ